MLGFIPASIVDLLLIVDVGGQVVLEGAGCRLLMRMGSYAAIREPN